MLQPAQDRQSDRTVLGVVVLAVWLVACLLLVDLLANSIRSANIAHQHEYLAASSERMGGG